MHIMLLILHLFVLITITNSIDISANVFGKEQHALPAAFGDFNSDELTDVFMIRNGGSVLEVFLASEKEPLLRPASGLRCAFTDFKVTSVVPGDFDGDAFMDILITTQNISDVLEPSFIQDIRIIWGGEDKLNCSEYDLPIKTTTIGHPLAMDYNDDMIIDIFGVNTQSMRTFWIFNRNRTSPIELFLHWRTHSIRLPHSHSFLDIDGDFKSDLLISSPTSFEVWLGNVSSEGFDFDHRLEIPIGLEGHIGQSLYLDVELTGYLYLVLPVCFSKECTNSSLLINVNTKWVRLNISFQDENGKNWGFVPPNVNMYTDTITMRAGDYNMDGFPDLLVTLRQEKQTESQAYLLENVACELCSFKRTFKIQWNAVTFPSGTVLSVFYDFYQDGILDFIFVRLNSTTMEYSIGAYKNSLEYDANFIKVMVLTGLTNKRVPYTIGTLGKKKGTYGTNLPGPRISYNTTSQDGQPRFGVCAQLPQSAYFVLNLPFTIFGLDRTPNFVDKITVGLWNHSRVWTQLIPNSQVVVIPRPPEDPSNWKALLFVTPSKNILKSVYVFTGICGLITILVISLHYKEKRDDWIEALSANNENEILS